MRLIKVGFLVSYDYNFIKTSLPLVYESADKIVLAIDKDRLSWTGNQIHINNDFFEWIKNADTGNKIEIYEDNFYAKGLTAMECDTRERNMLAKYMGEGGWHVQIDADEYFVDFSDFVKFLYSVEQAHDGDISVECEWIVLFKKTKNGYLLINKGGFMPMATTNPQYQAARIVKNQKTFIYPQRIIHDSWARSDEEMLMKLTNWSHHNDFDTMKYYNFWLSLNDQNYKNIKNFHPLNPLYWPGLEYIQAENIQALLNQLPNNSSLLKAEKQPGWLKLKIQSLKERFLKLLNQTWEANLRRI